MIKETIARINVILALKDLFAEQRARSATRAWSAVREIALLAELKTSLAVKIAMLARVSSFVIKINA
jgi:hypothetical protein